MTHVAVVCPPYTGHLNPMLTLADGLAERGHRLTVVGQPDLGPLAARPGIDFHGVGQASHPVGTLARTAARLRSTRGLLGIQGVIRDLVRTTRMLCGELPGAITDIGAEAILCDQTEAAGGLVARHLGLPQISVANALLINRDPLVPPPFVHWRFEDSDWGLTRNRGGYRIANLLMRPMTARIRAQAELWGLGPVATVEDCLSPLLQISQTVQGFDFPRRDAPDSLVHVGPLRGPEDARFWAADGRPLVFCSLGTLQGARAWIFRMVAEACLALDLGLVIAHGGHLAPEQAARLGRSAQVGALWPQRAVIAKADVVVTHGGLNTVLDALAAGVPLVVVPLAFEQGAIAARVERCGAGVVIRPGRLTARRLRDAIRTLRVDGAYRRNARRLASEIAAAGGVSRAVDLVEAALAPTLRPPVLSGAIR